MPCSQRQWFDLGQFRCLRAAGAPAGLGRPGYRRSRLVWTAGGPAASISSVTLNLSKRGVLSAPRFDGKAPEPRPCVRAGHMQGSLNLPFPSVVSKGRLRPPEEIRAEMEKAGIDLSRPVVCSCGSGVSAVVIAMAMSRAGVTVEAIYDGSWAEWGTREDMPVATRE